ncbi:hypothetical protein SAMN05446934_9582 [Paraburkholderia hospita]|nr:hypothetical protein PMI06_008616 [Burkholderia sp. BT03]SKC50240.1 hypothetical protein SAMN06266956_0341 [Paraburkholderia hospita]SKD05315.1 hypothetical protein SAMN05446934_9582 [Paraburkholderia hospita]
MLVPRDASLADRYRSEVTDASSQNNAQWQLPGGNIIPGGNTRNHEWITMRKLTPPGQQLIEEVAQRHGFSTDAVMSMLESVILF